MYVGFMVDVASGTSIVLVGALLYVPSLIIRWLRLRARKSTGRLAPDVLVPIESSADLFE